MAEDLNEILLDNGLEGSSYFINPDYREAIIGYTEQGNLAYDYDEMVNCLMNEDNISDVDAVEFIDYNTIRTIPYMPQPNPVIIHKLIQ